MSSSLHNQVDAGTEWKNTVTQAGGTSRVHNQGDTGKEIRQGAQVGGTGRGLSYMKLADTGGGTYAGGTLAANSGSVALAEEIYRGGGHWQGNNISQ